MTKWEIANRLSPNLGDFDIDKINHMLAPTWGQNPLESLNREPFFHNSNFNKYGEIFFRVLQSMAMNGWELVSVSPIIGKGGNYQFLLYTFKRPLNGKKEKVMERPITYERVEGPTAHGFVYAINYFLDDFYNPTTKDKAKYIEIVEFDENDDPKYLYDSSIDETKPLKPIT